MAESVTWYVLFQGTSVDGRGWALYKGRTTDKEMVRAFLAQESQSPYSTSYVMVITDIACKHVYNVSGL